MQKQTDPQACLLDARNHYPQNKHHTPPPRWSDNNTHPHKGENGPVASGPNSVPRTNPANATPEEATLVDDLEKFVAAQKFLHHRPPTTGAGANYPNHRIPQAWGRGKNGAP
ncbi:hypothetical protein MSEN_14400 [Mycolicibacter senuensis]|uniref:Uncharacterized protein n=1 Tax=Mycolicibacter senuensis TaxID=386913 RepID=A0A7I9XJL2_9MYCO|nr:hypothetical protein MSEN_14400 [Mycolicibacter senuensis]